MASFAFYYTATNSGWAPMPTDRVSQARYVARPSSKARYVLREAHRLRKLGQKLLVYADWPGSVWLMKTQLEIAGFKVARVSAGQSAKDRGEINREFNDPDDESIEVLVASSRSAAESFNYQKGCWNIIIMDVINFMTVLQIIGRCFRIGQKHEQYIKILTLNRTYDQVLLSQAATAMIAQLAATTGNAAELIPDTACEEAIKTDPAFEALCESRNALTQNGVLEEAREELYSRLVHEKFRTNFGVRSDRDNQYWADSAPDAKLLIEEEREFFLSHKGKVANHVRRLFDGTAFQTQPQTPTKPINKGTADHMKHLERTAERKAKVAAREVEAEAKARKAAVKAENARINDLKGLKRLQALGTDGLDPAIEKLERESKQCKSILGSSSPQG